MTLSRVRALGLSLACWVACSAWAAASPTSASAPLQACFDTEWEWRMRTFPEWATQLGDPRYNDRLADRSVQALDAQDAQVRATLACIDSVDRATLNERDQLSHDVFRHNAELAVAELAFPQLRTWGFSNKDGLHLGFPMLMRSMPLRNERDYRNYLARLAAFPTAVDQEIALLRQGIGLSWVTFRS